MGCLPSHPGPVLITWVSRGDQTRRNPPFPATTQNQTSGAMAHDSIAVIDFGGQYAHLIATKVRRRGVHAEIRQPEDPIDAFHGYRGIIISGSPTSTYRSWGSVSGTRKSPRTTVAKSFTEGGSGGEPTCTLSRVTICSKGSGP